MGEAVSTTTRSHCSPQHLPFASEHMLEPHVPYHCALPQLHCNPKPLTAMGWPEGNQVQFGSLSKVTSSLCSFGAHGSPWLLLAPDATIHWGSPVPLFLCLAMP